MRRTLMTLLLTVLGAAVFASVALAGSAPTHVVKLNGPADVPKGAPKGTGTFKYQDLVSKGEICYSLAWASIDSPVAAHIHKGKVGVAGPVVVTLSGNAPVAHSGCVHAPKSVLQAINAHPSQYYVNVHSKKYPAGAIRGQL